MKRNTSYNKKKYLLTGGITQFTYSEKEKFQVDEEGLFSLTSSKIAEYITTDIINLFPTDFKIKITDATASVGGNTIPFLLENNFSKVNIIEKNHERFNMLVSNINLKKDDIKNSYKLFNESFLDIKDTLEHDIVFIDPPWGGPDYHKKNKVQLYLDNIPLSLIINDLFNNKTLKYVVIKVPKNFDSNNFTLNLNKKLLFQKMTSSRKLKKMDIFYLKTI